MSKEEIRGLIGQVFDERINSAITKMTNQRNKFDERKDLETEEGSDERKISF